MTDLVLAVRLTAQDGGLVGQLQLTEGQLEEVKKAAQGAAGAAGTLKDSTGQAAAAMDRAAGSAEKLAASERAAASAAAGLGASQQSAAAAMSGAAAAQNGLAQSGKGVEASAKAQRQAFVQVSQQLSDIQVQAIAGTNAFLIFGQQGGQLAAAMSNLGGRIGAIGTYLAGPWGSAIIGAITLVGLFATSMFKGADATETLKQKQFDLGKFVDETTGKLARQITVIQALAAADQRAAEFGRQKLDYEKKRGELIAAGLAQGQQRTVAGERGFQIAVPTEISAGQREVARLSATYAQGAINAEQFSRAVDRLAASDPKLQGLATRIRQLSASTVDSARAAETTRLEVAKIAVAAGNATEAQRRLVEARKDQGPVNVSLIEAEAALATATDRTTRAREQLRLVELKGRDAAKAGGAAAEDYRRQLVAARTELNAAEAAETAARKSRTEGAKATREAAQAQRELESALIGIERQFDGVAAANRRYIETLETIEKLRRTGNLTPETADQYRKEAQLKNAQEVAKAEDDARRERLGSAYQYLKDGLAKPLIEAGDVFKTKMVEAGEAGARSFRTAGVDAAQAIAQAIGGRAGRAVGSALGLLAGAETGNFNSVGGRAGGILSLLSIAGRTSPADDTLKKDAAGTSRAASVGPTADLRRIFGETGGIREGLQSVTVTFEKSLGKLFEKVFGDKGIFAGSFGKLVGKLVGYGAVGGQVGGAVGSNLGGSIGGALGGAAGEKIFGKLLGNFAGPVGSIVGGLLGGVVGNLLKSTPRASATITSATDKAAVAGNNAGLRQAASGLATSVQGGLQQIAEALGGDLGNFAVSIGVRDKNFRVDPTGKGVTKTKKGAVDFGEDQGGAIAFAIADAIADGAIQGLTPKVAQALRSNSNIDQAIKDALKVQEIEDLLAGVDGAIGKTFRDLERQIAERNRIAAKYGFDLVKLEEQNAKDRAAAFQSVLADRVGSLQALLKDLDFGNLFEGSLVDQRQKLLDEIAQAETKAQAGEDGAAQQVADLRRRLLEVSREAFGTAGGEFATDLSSSRSSAERIIALENERAKSLADQARAQTDELKKGNELSNEANNILAEQNSILRQIASQYSLSGGSGAFAGGSGFFATERQALL